MGNLSAYVCKVIMAKSSAKKIFQKNTQRLSELRLFTVVSLALHFALRLVFVGGVLDAIWSVVGINAVFAVLYLYLTSLAKPCFDSRGNIEDAGEELNGDNLTAYMFDISTIF